MSPACLVFRAPYQGGSWGSWKHPFAFSNSYDADVWGAASWDEDLFVSASWRTNTEWSS